MANRPRNNTPPSSRKSRRNASTSSSSSSLSSLLPYFSSCVVSCPTACPGKRVGDRATATPMILCERGLVPRHKMLEKLVKGRRGGTEISRGKVERRNIRRTSGRTRLNERESCRSTGFLYFSARFCARFKRLHARATPQMSCYSKLADERGSSHVASTDVRPSELEDKTPVSREDSSLRGYCESGDGRKMNETNDPYAVALLTIIFRSSTDYNFCGRGAVRECAQRCHDFSRVISPRDLTDLQSNRTISNHFFSQIFRRGTFQWRKITIRYKSLIVLLVDLSFTGLRSPVHIDA